jgi:molybdopterin molybdotransferase
MISTDRATALILELSQAIADTELVPLHQAQGRVLAESVISKLAFPHWDNSAMDGYAVCWSDLQAYK